VQTNGAAQHRDRSDDFPVARRMEDSTRSAMTRSHRSFHDLWLSPSFVTHPLSAAASTTPETSTSFFFSLSPFQLPS
jgi:hypothetical protein